MVVMLRSQEKAGDNGARGCKSGKEPAGEMRMCWGGRQTGRWLKGREPPQRRADGVVRETAWGQLWSSGAGLLRYLPLRSVQKSRSQKALERRLGLPRGDILNREK